MFPNNPQTQIQTGKLAILLHDGILGTNGKTGLALLRYSQAEIVAIIDHQTAGQSLSQLTGINRDIPIVTSVAEALKYQPNILMIGIAPAGGILPTEWWEDLDQALTAGLSIVNGLHSLFIPLIEQRYQTSIDQILKPQQWIWDIRQEPLGLGIGSAKARSLPAKRVLAVGTDMAIGKMSTCLELTTAALKRGIRAKFIATGQAGLMLGGDGIPLDSIRVDYAAGAVEQIVVKSGSEYEILFVEGQGSLLHPGSTATLPLLRGTQPTHLILVHKANQTHIRNHPHIPIPPLPEVISMYEIVAKAAGALHPSPVVGIAVNTHHLTAEEAKNAIAQIQSQTQLPCTDVVRFGADVLLDAIL